MELKTAIYNEWFLAEVLGPYKPKDITLREVWNAAWQERGKADADVCESLAGRDSFDTSTCKYVAEEIRKMEEL